MKRFLFSSLMISGFIACLCVLIVYLSCPGQSAAYEASAREHQELQELAERGELTVRALRGWGVLPEEFVQLALELRRQDMDIMNADREKISDLARQARQQEGSPLNVFADRLAGLEDFMAEFMPSALREDPEAVPYSPPRFSMPVIPFVPELDVNTMSEMQYAGGVSMAMEGMRLVYGEMTPEDEQAFQAEWLPLFGHPSLEVVEYLNSLNPLILEFLALRSALGDALDTYNAISLELMTAAAEEDIPLLVESLDSVDALWSFYERLMLQMNEVVDQIVELGNPPEIDLEEIKDRHRSYMSLFDSPELDGAYERAPLSLEAAFAGDAPDGTTLHRLPRMDGMHQVYRRMQTGRDGTVLFYQFVELERERYLSEQQQDVSGPLAQIGRAVREVVSPDDEWWEFFYADPLEDGWVSFEYNSDRGRLEVTFLKPVQDRLYVDRHNIVGGEWQHSQRSIHQRKPEGLVVRTHPQGKTEKSILDFMQENAGELEKMLQEHILGRQAYHDYLSSGASLPELPDPELLHWVLVDVGIEHDLHSRELEPSPMEIPALSAEGKRYCHLDSLDVSAQHVQADWRIETVRTEERMVPSGPARPPGQGQGVYIIDPRAGEEAFSSPPGEVVRESISEMEPGQARVHWQLPPAVIKDGENWKPEIQGVGEWNWNAHRSESGEKGRGMSLSPQITIGTSFPGMEFVTGAGPQSKDSLRELFFDSRIIRQSQENHILQASVNTVCGTLLVRYHYRLKPLDQRQAWLKARRISADMPQMELDEDFLHPPEDEQLQAAELEEQGRKAQIEFHQTNIKYFEDNIRRLNQELQETTDPEARNNLVRSLLANRANLQEQQDYITSIQTGQFVRTRTELDALNMNMMLKESERMAEEARTINAIHERMHRLIGMADPEERQQLWDFYDRHIGSGATDGYTAEDARRVAHLIGDRVMGDLEHQAAMAEDTALAADDRLQRAKNLKSFCDNYLMVLSTVTPYYYAHTVPMQGVRSMRKARAAYAYATYQGATGYLEGGPAQAFTSSATGFIGTYSRIGWVAGKAKTAMDGYHQGVLGELEAHSRDPQAERISETAAGLRGAAWALGREYIVDRVKDLVLGAALPEIPAYTPEWSDVSLTKTGKRPGPRTFDRPKWPTVREQLDQAHMQSRQANARAKVSLFRQRGERLALAGQQGESREEVLRLRGEMDQAYMAIKTDYFAKAHMNRLGRQGEAKLMHYFNSRDRAYQKQLVNSLNQKMTEAGFSEQEYRTFSNSSSRGKVGMDLDLGVVEPPRYITGQDGSRKPNPAHASWRNSIIQTMPDGTQARRSPQDLQAAGQLMLQESFQEIYGHAPGEAMVNFTTSYHPEAYRDMAWLGRKGSRTALVHETDPEWVRQAADVSQFKVHHLEQDHPGMGRYGIMQENSRGLVKDFDTKIEPMLQKLSRSNPRAAYHARQLRDTMDMFAKDQLSPVAADRKIRKLTGGYGIEEVGEQFSVMMQGLRSQMPE